MTDTLNAMKQAARAAIGRVKQASLTENTDEDLQRYMTLKPSDFPAIMKRFGTEQTLAYIKEMESRLARRNNETPKSQAT